MKRNRLGKGKEGGQEENANMVPLGGRGDRGSSRRDDDKDGRRDDDRDRRPDDDRGEDLDHSGHLREQLEQQCVACRREQSGGNADLTNSSSGSKILNSKLI